MTYNPRFPHTLRVLRPELDEYGQPRLDENGDAIFHTMSIHKVVTIDDGDGGWEPVLRLDGSFETEIVDTIAWGYRTSTGGFHDSGEVAEANYKIATQPFTDHLYTGDVLEMTDYDRTFRVEVLKKTSYNWGANIWMKDVKN